MNMTPNLFLVGFQKCGSSTLFDLLTRHPEIKGSIPKETFFLTDKDSDNFNFSKQIENSEEGWNQFYPFKEKVDYLLEGSVVNFYQQTALNYLSNRKDIKVIFIIRNPVDRFKSNYKYYYGKTPGIPAGISIEEYYKKVKANAFEKDSLKYAIEHGKYLNFIEQWKQVLGKEQIFILSFEQLIHKTEEVLKELYAFLELGFEYDNCLPHKNQSMAPAYPKMHQALVKFVGGTIVSNSLTKAIYKKLFPDKNIQISIPSKLREALEKEYQRELKHFHDYFYLEE